MPPYSSGIVTPKRPSSRICSTTASGNLSSWSCSSAIGRTSLSTNCRTISVMAFCSSVLSVYGLVATAIQAAPVSLTRESTKDTAGASPLAPVG